MMNREQMRKMNREDEEKVKRSPIDLEVRYPLGSHWIHVHFEGCQEFMQLLIESSTMVALFSHLSVS